MADRAIVDHSLVENARVLFEASRAVTPNDYVDDPVVERNIMRDSSLWDETGNGIPWVFIKGSVEVTGVTGKWHRVGERMEVTAIWGRGGTNRLVVRHNDISGYFNGIGGYHADFDGNAMRDTDIHDNHFSQLPDDTLEPEGGIVNWRMWHNRAEDTYTAVSLGPVRRGPLYLVRNSWHDIGGHGVAAISSIGGFRNQGIMAFKFSGSSVPKARIYVIGNTFWTDRPTANGGVQAAGGGPDQESFYLRNNLFIFTRYAFDGPFWDDVEWNEDYNYFATSDPARGMDQYNTIEAYRTGSGEGEHTNTFGNLHDVIQPDDPRLIDAGVVVPNLDEMYTGAAPDIGTHP
jgi:hypothetical protein